MLTLHDLLSCRHGTIFQHVTLKDSRGNPLRCRVNGRLQTWKTRPGEFKLPVKHGLRDCFYVTQANAHEWTLS